MTTMKGTLDLPGSREIIGRIASEYEKALDDGDGRKALDAKQKLDRWSWPLARWYLDQTRKDERKRSRKDHEKVQSAK